jgi:hypothetical protein
MTGEQFGTYLNSNKKQLRDCHIISQYFSSVYHPLFNRFEKAEFEDYNKYISGEEKHSKFPRILERL